MVIKFLLREIACFPSSNSCSRYGNPINSSRRIGNVATDICKALSAEKLTRAMNRALTLKAVSNRGKAGLSVSGSNHPERWILG